MPWEHCGHDLLDTTPCPDCGETKAQWTLEWNVTRQFAVSRSRVGKALKVTLVDPEGAPVQGERALLEPPGGEAARVKLDDYGYASVKAPEAGVGAVTFVDRHPSEVRLLEPKQFTPGDGGGGALLQRGSEGAAVSALQQQLIDRGYPVGADGSFGPETEGAVRWFQGDYGLAIDGVVGPETRGALAAEDLPPQPLPPPPPTLARGDRGAKVRKLQETLGIAVDGKFGPDTEQAVREAQEGAGLEANGGVDPLTWDALLGTRPGDGARFPCPTGTKQTYRLVYARVVDVEPVLQLELRTGRVFPDGAELVVEGLAAPLTLAARDCHREGLGYVFALGGLVPGATASATIRCGDAAPTLFEGVDLHAHHQLLEDGEAVEPLPLRWPLELLRWPEVDGEPDEPGAPGWLPGPERDLGEREPFGPEDEAAPDERPVAWGDN